MKLSRIEVLLRQAVAPRRIGAIFPKNCILEVVVKPVLQALVLAQRVFQDAKTGNKIICGTFNRIVIKTNKAYQTAPIGAVYGGAHPGSPSLYISITDVCPGTQLIMQLVSLERNQPILETGLRIGENTNRLDTIEIVADLPPLVPPIITQAGVYALELVCEGEILGSHRIYVEVTDE